MIIPVLCFTCGKPLADKYDYYVSEVNKMKEEKGKEQKGGVEGIKHFDEMRTGPILDKLGLKRYCCRRHMLTTVDMMDTI
jgi:DNA-directed RNA polymerase subunit N (RpoN/RPB10)